MRLHHSNSCALSLHCFLLVDSIFSGNACGGFVQRYTITAQIEFVFELEVPPLDELEFLHDEFGTGVLR